MKRTEQLRDNNGVRGKVNLVDAIVSGGWSGGCRGKSERFWMKKT